MDFDAIMEVVVLVFEVAGVAIFAIGSLIAVARVVIRWTRGERSGNYQRVRRDIGRSILLGLEVLIIADIVHTIILDLTFESAASLALIVIVRTFLSFSLEVELEGAFPWRMAALRRSTPAGAASDQPPGTELISRD